MERPHLRLALAAVLWWPMCAPAQSPGPQDSPSSPAASQGDKKQQNQPAPPAAQQFPYPGETPPPADSGSAAPPQLPSGSAPSAPNAGRPFPYPGDPEAGSSSSSSSSSSASGSDDSSTPELPKDAAPMTRHKLPKQFHPQSPEDRATEDLEVAHFYQDRGDLQAAYLRAQDAVKQLPRDPEAHLVLGQIAQKMKHRDEAVTELNAYLRLEPDGDHVKEVRRLLAQIR